MLEKTAKRNNSEKWKKMKLIAIIPKAQVERATFTDGIEITEDARLLIGSKLWNATIEDAQFIEIYVDTVSKTVIIKPVKIDYIV